jgi:DNA-3-methyladenine glycosylase
VTRRPLAHAFFDRPAPEVARDLLGKVLVSVVDGVETGGRIVETEAYLGADDPGSHASTRGITKRNAVMYAAPGSVYVYFTYGNHHMLNLVAEAKGIAGGVLIRAIEPVVGVETMAARRLGRPILEMANGPGKLAAALGLDLSDNGTLLGHGRVVVYDAESIPDDAVATSGRIGLSAGHELPLRFYVTGSPFVSRGRIGPSTGRARRSAKGAAGEAS